MFKQFQYFFEKRKYSKTCVDIGMRNDWNPVTPDPKRLVSGPCWNLYLEYQLFESLSPCCCHDVPCEQQWTQCILVR